MVEDAWLDALHQFVRTRPMGLRWGCDVLAEVELTRATARVALTELECSFVAAGQRRAQRLQWLRRSVIALAIVGVGTAREELAGTQGTRLIANLL